jgi:6-phosphogluconate dehydrogenase (decarboxylating)
MAECRTQIPYRAALFRRFDYRGDAGYADRRLLCAMRKQFGGHGEKQVESGTSQLRKVT